MVSAEVSADGAAAPATRHDVEVFGVGQVQLLDGGSSVVPALTVEAAGLRSEHVGVVHTPVVNQLPTAAGACNVHAQPPLPLAHLALAGKSDLTGQITDATRQTVPVAAVADETGSRSVSSLECVGLRVVGARHDNPLSRHHHGALMGRDVDNQVLPPACA